MSTRTTLRPHTVVDAQSMASDITSEATVLQSLTKVAYQFSWAGSSPVGDLSVQLSNDYALDASGNILNAGTWTTGEVSYNGSVVTSIPISGNAGNGIIEVTSSAYATRVFYDATSGTGSMTAVVCGKVS